MSFFARHQVRAFVSLLIVMFVVTSSLGQAVTPVEVFSPVPQELSPRLIERFNSYVESYRTKQWGEHYDLLDTRHDFFLLGTREQYVTGRIANSEKDERLVEFVPQTVTYDESFEEWKIDGCSRWRKEGDVKASISARFIDGDWYFSLIGIELLQERIGDTAWRADSRKPVPCENNANNDLMTLTPR